MIKLSSSEMPANLRATCAHWAINIGAMRQVADRKSFDPRKLHNEAVECIAIAHAGRQTIELAALREWAGQQMRLAEAAAALKKAAKLKREAIELAVRHGMERWQAEDIFDQAAKPAEPGHRPRAGTETGACA